MARTDNWSTCLLIQPSGLPNSTGGGDRRNWNQPGYLEGKLSIFEGSDTYYSDSKWHSGAVGLLPREMVVEVLNCFKNWQVISPSIADSENENSLISKLNNEKQWGEGFRANRQPSPRGMPFRVYITLVPQYYAVDARTVQFGGAQTTTKDAPYVPSPTFGTLSLPSESLIRLVGSLGRWGWISKECSYLFSKIIADHDKEYVLPNSDNLWLPDKIRDNLIRTHYLQK